MSHLLDTDICIYWLNGHTDVRTKLLKLGWDKVAISVITQAELYFGAYNSSRVSENLQRANTFIDKINVCALSNETLSQFGKSKTELRKTGKPLADFDLLIASTAIIENKVLVTNNTRHYERISDLVLENWMAGATEDHE